MVGDLPGARWERPDGLLKGGYGYTGGGIKSWLRHGLLFGVALSIAPPTQALTSGEYFLHSATSDFLNTTSPTATTAKLKDSPAVNRTTFQVVGVWAAAPADSALRLTALSDLHVWIGLKNSDDQGTYFDLRAALRKNGTVVASGEETNIQGVTRDPNKAKEVTVAFGGFAAVQLVPGDILSLRILTKVTAQGGHNSAVGLRLYYDAVSRPSRFGATFTACSAEVCNGVDDDCDSEVDEGLGTLTCGVGACSRTVAACVNGQPGQCVPGAPTAELCNGIDDNCNGATDEGFNVGSACTAGVGACARSGVMVCSADRGGTFCNATPGAPTTEVCNGVDDNYGQVNDDLGTLTCGEGACSRTVAACTNGQPGQCTPGSPSPETCNGVDDDCDGTTDNGFDIGASCTVGIGACQSAGVKVCSADGVTAICNAALERRSWKSVATTLMRTVMART